MKRIPLFICLVACISLKAQIQGSIHIGSNVSMVNSVSRNLELNLAPVGQSGFISSTVNYGSVKEIYDPKTGFQVNGKIDFKASRKFFISTGLGINYLRYKRNVQVASLSSGTTVVPTDFNRISGQPFGVIRPWQLESPNQNTTFTGVPAYPGNTSLISTQMPVLAGVSLLNDKLLFRSGITLNYLLNAHYKHNVYSMQTGSVTNGGTWPLYTPGSNPTGSFEQKTYNNTKGYTKFTTGLTVEVSYKFLKVFSADLAYQKSLTPIYEAEMRSGGKAKMTSVSLGLSYRFNYLLSM